MRERIKAVKRITLAAIIAGTAIGSDRCRAEISLAEIEEDKKPTVRTVPHLPTVTNEIPEPSVVNTPTFKMTPELVRTSKTEDNDYQNLAEISENGSEAEIKIIPDNPVITEYDVKESHLPYKVLKEIASAHNRFTVAGLNYLVEGDELPDECENYDQIRVVVQKEGRSMLAVGVVSDDPQCWLILTQESGERILDMSDFSLERFEKIGLSAEMIEAPEDGSLRFKPGRIEVFDDSNELVSIVPVNKD